MLAALFLVAVWLDPSQPARSAIVTYAMIGTYLVVAVAIAVGTWRNWWLDARLAVPSHFVDMALFTGVVFSTNGYTSPFFVIFMLPLLSATIRWGWRETALTALALVLLYFSAGLLVAGSQPFELQRFMVRTADLVILTALLIWFGVHQRYTRLFFHLDDFDAGPFDKRDPLEQALRLAMDATGARSGLLLVGSSRSGPFTGPRLGADEPVRASLERPLLHDSSFAAAFLYDLAKDRAVSKSPRGISRFARASRLFDPAAASRLELSQGLISHVRTGTFEGWLVLEQVLDLSTDFISLGVELGHAAGVVIERHALLVGIEEGASASARLTLARDVHDSVVQFLAGASFRVEAIARAARKGENVDGDLEELKHLLVEEQQDIRRFVSAVRRDRDVELSEAVEELRSLAARLGQQWSVDCSVSSAGKEAQIPIGVQLDVQQLLREAVANAVRHGGADRVDATLAVDGDVLRLDVVDNGTGFTPPNGAAPIEPWSLKERVDRASGSLELASEAGHTRVSIGLPLNRASA